MGRKGEETIAWNNWGVLKETLLSWKGLTGACPKKKERNAKEKRKN